MSVGVADIGNTGGTIQDVQSLPLLLRDKLLYTRGCHVRKLRVNYADQFEPWRLRL